MGCIWSSSVAVREWFYVANSRFHNSSFAERLSGRCEQKLTANGGSETVAIFVTCYVELIVFKKKFNVDDLLTNVNKHWTLNRPKELVIYPLFGKKSDRNVIFPSWLPLRTNRIFKWRPVHASDKTAFQRNLYYDSEYEEGKRSS
jgi:hypothetical protein